MTNKCDPCHNRSIIARPPDRPSTYPNKDIWMAMITNEHDPPLSCSSQRHQIGQSHANTRTSVGLCSPISTPHGRFNRPREDDENVDSEHAVRVVCVCVVCVLPVMWSLPSVVAVNVAVVSSLQSLRLCIGTCCLCSSIHLVLMLQERGRELRSAPSH